VQTIAVASKHPSALSEMVAYMLMITKVAQQFEDLGYIMTQHTGTREPTKK